MAITTLSLALTFRTLSLAVSRVIVTSVGQLCSHVILPVVRISFGNIGSATEADIPRRR